MEGNNNKFEQDMLNAEIKEMAGDLLYWIGEISERTQLKKSQVASLFFEALEEQLHHQSS